MGFSVFVEILNIRRQSRVAKPIELHDPYHETTAADGEPEGEPAEEGESAST
jgi:hypothetical protein